jgi:acetyl esterase
MAAMFPPIDFARSGAEHRRILREAASAVIHEGGEPIGHVADQCVDGPRGPVPIRVYHPLDAPQGPLAVAVFTHGGGWVVCDLDSHDGMCRAVANASHCVVVAVDYRLAPEHRFPAGLEDAYAVLEWVAANAHEIEVDPSRLAVVGDSAGGNLAAALTLMARERVGPRIAAQVLVYPVTDHDFTTESHNDPGDPKVLQSDEVQYFWQEYLSDARDASNPYASPMRAPSLRELPPALVITAEFDPLRDEGEAYAHRLADAGVPVELVRYDGMMHSFVTFLDALPAARLAVDRIARHLRSM